MNEVLWYTARSAGLVGAGLLALSTILGLALSTAPRGARPRPAWRLDLHRFVGGLAVIFTGVHVLGIMLDSYIHFGLVQVLVPFTSTWRPWAVSLGVVALYLLLAVELTSLARHRMPRTLWRNLHHLSFPLLVVAQLHLLLAGTDAASPWVLGAVAACDLAIAALAGRRILTALEAAERRAVVPVAAPARSNGAARPAAQALATAVRSSPSVPAVAPLPTAPPLAGPPPWWDQPPAA